MMLPARSVVARCRPSALHKQSGASKLDVPQRLTQQLVHCESACRPASTGDHAEALSLSSLAAKVEEWLPDAAGAGEDGTFPEAVAEQIRPAAIAQFEEAQAAIFLAGAEVDPSGASNL